MKKCKSCKNIKSLDEFHAKQYKCKVCKSEEDKAYYQNNKEKILDKTAKYQKKIYKEDKKIILDKQKKYQQTEKGKSTRKKYEKDNKEKLNNYYKEYKKRPEVKKRRRQRLNNNPKEKIRHLISNSILLNLKKRNATKEASISKYLKFTIDDLIIHLENLFELWMSWENHGKYNPKTWDDNDPSTWTWQIDHIIPHSTFNYTSMEDDEFQKCWSLSNLRPLSAKQNIIEGTNRIRHKENKYG